MKVTSPRSRVKLAEGVYVVEPVFGSARRRYQRLKRKREAVDFLGDVCYRCRGQFHLSQYTFHHTDPSVKTTHPDRSTIFSPSGGLTRALTEADKEELRTCELLCSNCHAVADFGKEGTFEYYIERNGK